MTIQDQTNIKAPQGAVTTAPVIAPEIALNTCSSAEPEVISNGTALAIMSRSSIYQERLRQAQMSFNLAFCLTAASAIIVLAGVQLLFSGNVPVGAVTTTGGFITGKVGASWLKLAKDANDRLDETARALEAK